MIFVIGSFIIILFNNKIIKFSYIKTTIVYILLENLFGSIDIIIKTVNFNYYYFYFNSIFY